MDERHHDISGVIVDTAINVHRSLGPGLLESVYLNVMAFELRRRNLAVATEVPMPLIWDNLRFEVGFRADMIVADLIIVEFKSVESISPVHKKQVLTYLRLSDKRLGLLLNFGSELMKDGIFRIVNDLKE
jgi:GxxExxY protein